MKNNVLFTLLFTAISLLFMTNLSIAQSVDRELGLRMAGLDNFNFIYKKQTSENKFLRFRAGAFNVNFNSNSEAISANVNLAIGLEKRKPIDDRLLFIHGFEPSIQVGFSEVNGNTQILTGLSIGYVLGFHLNINESFGLNIETIPSLSGTTAFNENNDDITNLRLGFNSNAIALSAVYRFNK
ncbi:MAG: hypothetical protein AB8B53_10655 [Flavobacteriales bacterium]